jgi:hypothetical protein
LISPLRAAVVVRFAHVCYGARLMRVAAAA